MDIVAKVAADIAEIPGNPSVHEIARVAIEAYQRELWRPAFDISSRGGMVPELRRNRATQLTAHIMCLIGEYLCDHGENRGSRKASAVLFEALYESGADIITDADRTTAGLRPRGPYGVTAEELRIMEAKRMEAMLRPMPPIVITAGITAGPVLK